jgi:FMN phosphatase YigB (HAD superfamily)
MKKIKLIFLDIDGVLINHESCMDRTFRNKPHPKCVAALNRLLELSGAWIIVSSSWRLGRTRIELCALLNEWGVTPGHVLDRTGQTSLGDRRGDEIREWLKACNDRGRYEIESFIILDDETDMLEFLPRLVKTSMDGGLTDAHVDLALEMLK